MKLPLNALQAVGNRMQIIPFVQTKTLKARTQWDAKWLRSQSFQIDLGDEN